MHIQKISRVLRSRSARMVLAAASLSVFAFPAHAQMGGGQQSQGSTSPPAASIVPKKNADRDDPIEFLLSRKKLLLLDKTQEDSLKAFKKEMKRMQDVTFKELDKNAARKEQGQLPGAAKILLLTKEAELRVKDVQSAYRDRARQILNPKQQTQVDSLESVWKRANPAPAAKADSSLR